MTANSNANWNYPTAMRSGPGRIKELAELCAAHNISAPLLVTDPGLAGLPMVQRSFNPVKMPVWLSVCIAMLRAIPAAPMLSKVSKSIARASTMA